MSTRRVFIDPGSKSAGWALFAGKLLLVSGTAASESQDVGDADAFRRLAIILGRFGLLHGEIYDEVHLEQLVRNTHVYTHWAVGALGTFFASQRPGMDTPEVRADIAISSWQRFCGWEKLKDSPQALTDVEVTFKPLKKLQQEKKVASVDELAAVGMGFYWVNEGCLQKKVGKRVGIRSQRNG